MDDLTITKLCAEAMGLEKPRIIETLGGEKFVTYGPEDSAVWPQYWPLQYDAQAMALVKRFYLGPIWTGRDWCVQPYGHSDSEWVYDADLNRAICEAVAKMQAASSAAQGRMSPESDSLSEEKKQQ